MDSKAYKVIYDAYRDLYYKKKQEQYMMYYRYINLKDKDDLTDIEKEELENIKKSLIL